MSSLLARASGEDDQGDACGEVDQGAKTHAEDGQAHDPGFDPISQNLFPLFVVLFQLFQFWTSASTWW